VVQAVERAKRREWTLERINNHAADQPPVEETHVAGTHVAGTPAPRTDATAATAADSPSQVAIPHSAPLLSTAQQLTLSVLWFALNFLFAALLPVVIPAQILFVAPGAAGNAHQAAVLGGLAALGAVAAVIVQPIVGELSDRTPGRFGRRRPYILAGAVALLAGLGILALSHALPYFILGLFLVVVGHTMAGAAYQGLLPDHVPPEQHGAASGYMGLMTILGTVGSLAVAALLLSHGASGHAMLAGIAHGATIFYLLAAAILVAGVAITCVGVREAPLSTHAGSASHATIGPEDEVVFADGPIVALTPTDLANDTARGARARLARWAQPWLHPWRHHNFRWVFLTRAFVMLGLALFATFIEYYFASVEHVSNFVRATAFNAVMALLGAVASTLVIGLISDRTRRAPVVFVATTFMALTALAFVVAPGSIPLWPLGLLFGLGYGAYTSVDWALALDALPSRKAAGKDLGLWGVASTVPSILAPVLGSGVIVAADRFHATALGYRAVFALAALFLLLGAVFVLRVRESHRPYANRNRKAV
jgi:MFS family permease